MLIIHDLCTTLLGFLQKYVVYLCMNRYGVTVTTLMLCQWPESTFDPAQVLTMFPRVRRLSIVDSNITSFVSNFTGAEFLQV